MAGPSSIYEGANPLLTSPLDLFIIQLIIVVIVAKVLSYFFKFIKQPSVIAEVITGILLGPSVMGFVPGFTVNIFPTTSITIFNVIANVGLILFMFLVGLEVDPALMRRNLKGSAVISITAMVLPFVLGIGASAYIWNEMPMTKTATFASFLLFVGVAVSITAFPVLARILTDQGLTQSKVGIIALSSAAVDDVTAWIMLAVVVSIARSSGSLTAVYTLLVFAGYVVLMVVVLRPILSWLSKRVHARESMKHEFVILILVLLFISAWTTDVIGVHSMFGGFFLGVITPRGNGFAMRMTERIEDLIMIILVPLYFTYSGLRTDLSTLNTWQAGVTVVLIIAVSMLGKIGGATIASRLLRNSWRESLTIGFLLNTKGLVELVVLNVGLDIGVLTKEIFAAFVVMAIWNTILTTPIVWLLWTRTEKKRNPMMRKSSDYSMLVCIPEARIGVSMVTIAGALAKAHAKGIDSKRKPRIEAVHLTEISERPSTYFFALRLDKSDAVEFARQRASVLDVTFKVTARASANIADDLTKIANSRVQDLVILGWNRQKSDRINEGGRRVNHLMQHIRAPVGIFVDKGRLRDRTNVERVLFVYSFHSFEREAVKVALEMARDPDVHLTIVVPRKEWLMRDRHHQSAEHDMSSSTDALTPRDTNHASSSTSAATPAAAAKKKGAAWHQYFDILFLFGLLARLVRRCIHGPRKPTSQRRRPGASSPTTSARKEDEVEMEERAAAAAVAAARERRTTGERHDSDDSSSSEGEDLAESPRVSLSDRPDSIALETAGAASGKYGLGSLLPSAFSAEQKRAEEQLMETFDGVQALVRARPSMSLIVSESDDVLAEALDQEAKHVYQMIVIGNERKWSRTHQHVHHLNLHRHHLPHISFGRHDDIDDDAENDDAADGDDGSVQFSDLVGSSTTSLLVVHPPLESPAYIDTRRSVGGCFECLTRRRHHSDDDDDEGEEDEDVEAKHDKGEDSSSSSSDEV